ncbi:MAG: YidB family protein [Parvularculaceae bacterium]
MKLMDIAANLLSEKMGVDAGEAAKGLEGLIGDGQGGVNVASLVGMFQQGGMADAVSSWLGDGSNASIDADAVKNALGGDQVASAAAQSGVDADALAGGLSAMLPDLIDRASSGGELLKSMDDFRGLADFAKKFF